MAVKIILPARAAPQAAVEPISSELEVRIRKRFPNPEGSFNLNVHFRALAGFTILFGASGAGKTTLLDCIAGLTDPDEGRIAIGGEDLYDSENKRNLVAWKRSIGYVHQDLALFPHLTAEENVAYGLRSLSAVERQSRSREILAAFRIDHLRDRRPAQIAGGERQRVALARTLVTNPRALLLDEPLAALDRPTKSSLVGDLRKWNQLNRVPILFVTHSSEEVFALGDEVIVLDAGRIVAQGRPHEVMCAPRLETVAHLSGFENIFGATVTALHATRGTMTCRLGTGEVELETPLVSAEIGSRLRVGIRAGDLLLATASPQGLSARNILPGTIRQLVQRDVMVSAMVDCGGAEFEVHLTLAARDDLQLGAGKSVWIVIKTHSCHLMGG
ncbi:MAG TPA: molybdenum ABC transporter ATP-binding protein [Terriglobales bacterium]|jgi:molybdate transport system ATP-binding protein|nr:molybdenum ABC transporter ATP-binding protein [Terriglobales bacterium]